METRPQDHWTLSKAFAVGDVKSLAYHDVEVLEIVESLPHYNVCRVRVIGPTNAGVAPDKGQIPTPPLKWRGELYA